MRKPNEFLLNNPVIFAFAFNISQNEIKSKSKSFCFSASSWGSAKHCLRWYSRCWFPGSERADIASSTFPHHLLRSRCVVRLRNIQADERKTKLEGWSHHVVAHRNPASDNFNLVHDQRWKRPTPVANYGFSRIQPPLLSSQSVPVGIKPRDLAISVDARFLRPRLHHDAAQRRR